jgi:hypothetical protein
MSPFQLGHVASHAGLGTQARDKLAIRRNLLAAPGCDLGGGLVQLVTKPSQQRHPLGMITSGSATAQQSAHPARLHVHICEHCPNFRTDPSFLAVLGTQRVDAQALAADAEARGWTDEVARHRRLVERLAQLTAHTSSEKP